MKRSAYFMLFLALVGAGCTARAVRKRRGQLSHEEKVRLCQTSLHYAICSTAGSGCGMKAIRLDRPMRPAELHSARRTRRPDGNKGGLCGGDCQDACQTSLADRSGACPPSRIGSPACTIKVIRRAISDGLRGHVTASLAVCRVNLRIS
jgi:hypothetical protein